MSNYTYLSHADILAAVRGTACMILPGSKIYGVPRGGIPVAYLLMNHADNCSVVDSAEEADVIVDDLIDSGRTRAMYPENKRFVALFRKTTYLLPPNTHSGLLISDRTWLVFPWERSVEHSAEDIGVRLLQYIGENPDREGLLDTPKRFLNAWSFWTKGYKENPADVMKVFEDGGEGYDEMILVKDIPLFSTCEHHLAAIIGTASVAYIPDGHILGLSKIARVVDIFARRLQVQERLTAQIADCLMEHLQPKGVGVIVKARHLCMESRGVERPGTETTTVALRGGFKTNPETRAEFMSIIR